MKAESEKYAEWDQLFLEYFCNKKYKLRRDLTVLKKLGILNQRKELRILELFCGKGECQELLIDNGYINAFGSDLSETLVRQARKDCRIKVCICDSTNIPYKSNVFDLIFINEGLHHLKDYNAIGLCFNEIKRVLKEAGLFVFYEPENTIFRKLASVIIFSPLSNISQHVRLLREILIKEMKEYSYWLRNSPQILRLLENIGFSIERYDKTPIHMAVISRLADKSI